MSMVQKAVNATKKGVHKTVRMAQKAAKATKRTIRKYC
jgi:hypothetical protein